MVTATWKLPVLALLAAAMFAAVIAGAWWGGLIPRDRPVVTNAPLAAIARAPAVKPPADASSHPPAQLVASMEVRPSTWPPVASIVPTVAHDDTTIYAEAGCPVWGWASTTSAARASPLNGARDEWCGNVADAEAHITSVGRADTSGSSGRGESGAEIDGARAATSRSI